MPATTERLDARDLDLDTADEVADLLNASNAADGVPFHDRSGAEVLTDRQLGFDS
ncbi:MAG: hypothetical protein HOQ22_17455, partial [Nocardioidaceae bacterium]|nr:hypothetical protein [Nocardioidaceae bacterium]